MINRSITGIYWNYKLSKLIKYLYINIEFAEILVNKIIKNKLNK